MNIKKYISRLWGILTLLFMIFLFVVLNVLLKFPLSVVLLIYIAYFVINIIIFRKTIIGEIGFYHHLLGHFDKARKIYQYAVKKNTASVNCLNCYSVMLLREGNAEEALALVTKALKINTKPLLEKNLTATLGSCYWVLGDIDKAIETYEGLEKKYSYINADMLTTKGYLYLLKGDYEKSLEYTNTALADKNEHAPAWDNLGQIYYQQGELEKAKEAFSKALLYHEKLVDSNFYLGLIYEKFDEIEKAKEYFAKAKNCNISFLNSVRKEQIIEKCEYYNL